MQKKAILFLIKLAVTLGLFTLLFRPETFGLDPDFWGEDISFRSLLDEIRSVETHNIVVWIIFAIVVKLAGMLCGVLRWRLLLHGQGLRVPFWYMVQSWFVGRFIGIFLPGTIGLDGYRLYDSSMYTREVIKCTTVIAVEKLIGFIALTLLVFVTFPLGYRLLNFNVPVLAVCLMVFGAFVLVSLLVLLNPRLIQVLASVIPTPAKIRNQVNTLGAAATAYSGKRSILLLALLFGVFVHVGTCLMYFGTMSAIRAENTTIFDIFFTSPLMIWGTVLGPSVGGEGIREIVFTTVLGAKSGTTKAFLIAHLGWWVGELIPFFIGLPIFLFRTRPGRETIQAELARAREQAAGAKELVHLTPETVAGYRARLIDCLLAGLLAGLIIGALTGLAEGVYLYRSVGGFHELRLFWWGAAAYAVMFSPVGLGIAAALAFVYLLIDRFPTAKVTAALALGGTAAAATLIIAGWRFYRDVLGQHMPSLSQGVMLLAVALGLGVAVTVLAAVALFVSRGGRRVGVAGGAAVVVVLWVVGVVLSFSMQPAAEDTVAFEPKPGAKGPNMILVAIDALRADFLSMYSREAEAKTPQLDVFAQDAIFFPNGFAQSTWTKPSFATIFTGLYPEGHTATSKVSSLPDEIDTLAEVLSAGGYYTKGFSNNPNITAMWLFDQGFVDYTDLKPSAYYFGASASVSKLSLYEVLRKGRQRLIGKVSKKLVVTEFYQPAEVLTREALGWLDSGAVPEGTPFYLFLHYMDPHDPFMVAGKPGAPVDKPRVGYARARIGNPPPELADEMRQAYNDDIEYMDVHLGALFDGLRARGLYDDALIVFTADHGEEFYDHGGWWHGQTLYDELMRVPLVVKLPGDARAGETNPYFARHIDIPVTMIQMAGLTKPEAMPGKPLFGEDRSDTNADTTCVYAEVDFEGNDLQAVRTYDKKVIHANEGNPRDIAPVECYDLAADPLETTNLCTEGQARPEGTDALDRFIDEMRASIEANAAEPVLSTEVAGDTAEQLRALGYLE